MIKHVLKEQKTVRQTKWVLKQAKKQVHSSCAEHAWKPKKGNLNPTLWRMVMLFSKCRCSTASTKCRSTIPKANWAPSSSSSHTANLNHQNHCPKFSHTFVNLPRWTRLSLWTFEQLQYGLIMMRMSCVSRSSEMVVMRRAAPIVHVNVVGEWTWYISILIINFRMDLFISCQGSVFLLLHHISFSFLGGGISPQVWTNIAKHSKKMSSNC